MQKFLVILILVWTCFVFHAASVTLAWNPSPDASVVGYKMYYGTNSGVYNQTNVLGNVTTCNITNLTEGVTYFFAAKAHDISGVESDFSNEVGYLVPIIIPPLSPPSPPQNFDILDTK